MMDYGINMIDNCIADQLSNKQYLNTFFLIHGDKDFLVQSGAGARVRAIAGGCKRYALAAFANQR